VPRYHPSSFRPPAGRSGFALLVLVGVFFGLFILHGVEIWTNATLYYIGALHSFEDALYFSTATYATIGNVELTLSRTWRILGAIEGANGVILPGWSTAFFLSIVGGFAPSSMTGQAHRARIHGKEIDQT
jgi:hypothetical protein